MNKSYKSNQSFWKNLDNIVESHEIVVERPIGSKHPRYPDFIYPIDYGYLKNTKSSDGLELDVWIGNMEFKRVTGVLIITDMVKMDTEQKVLYGCTEQEMEIIYEISNQHQMNAILLIRDN
ncbi:MAG: inorganic pyrophosphatase [Bacteroidales bacterium]|nr:inorganic pyrophosphatase [Bacteroidales bacterium]